MLSFAALTSALPAILAMAFGAVCAAFVGTSWVASLSEERLERVILVLLFGIGTALVVEGFLPTAVPALVPVGFGWQVVTGLCFGLAVGLVSSMLGVAGGELIIPILIFAYAVDVKVAGTASLLISLPTVLMGVFRYGRQGAFDRQPLLETVAPMGAGSVLGAIVGGLLVGVVSSTALKFGLGIILMISAARIFHHSSMSKEI